MAQEPQEDLGGALRPRPDGESGNLSTCRGGSRGFWAAKERHQPPRGALRALQVLRVEVLLRIWGSSKIGPTSRRCSDSSDSKTRRRATLIFSLTTPRLGTDGFKASGLGHISALYGHFHPFFPSTSTLSPRSPRGLLPAREPRWSAAAHHEVSRSAAQEEPPRTSFGGTVLAIRASKW